MPKSPLRLRSGFIVVALFLFLSVLANAQRILPREVEYPTMDPCRQGGCRSPKFDNGYFIQLHDYKGSVPPDGYELWAPDGSFLYHINIMAPDGTPARVSDVTMDRDGTAAAAMWYGGYGGNGHVAGGGVAVIDPTGKQLPFIATGRWLPDHPGFGSDHAIWVSGTQFEPLRDGDPVDHVWRADYQLLRKYSREGKLLGEFLPRSSFPAGLPPASNGAILAANDRIGVILYPGKLANFPEWVEVGLDGTLIGRWSLGPDSTSDPVTHNATRSRTYLTFTADGRLFTESDDHVAKSHQIVVFDRSTSSWQSADPAVNVPPGSYLVGADGNNLAFLRRIPTVSIIRVPARGAPQP
jgi:hypothetical protein